MNNNQIINGVSDKELFEHFKSQGAGIFAHMHLPEEFSVETVRQLEQKSIDFIKEAKKTKEPIYTITVVVTGFMLGETIASLFDNAKWVTDADEIWDYYVELSAPDGSTFKAYPFIRASKFFGKYKTYGLTSYLYGVQVTSQKGLSNL